MAGLTESELAERAGTTAGEVRRFADLGLLVEQEGDAGYSPTEVQLIRLVLACEQSGIDPADIARAIEMGQLSLAFTSMSWAQAWGAYTGKTYGDFCRETGLSMELVQRLNEFMGFPRPVPEDPVREDHAEMFPALAAMRGMGVAEPVLTRATRVFGENLRRVAQEGTRLFHSEIEVPLLASGMSERQMRELTGQIGDQIGPLVERLVLWLYRQDQEHFIIQDLVEHIESAMEQAGLARRRPVQPPAIVFLDLVGYTRLTEERGDQVAAELAARLAEMVQRISHVHDGRPVKWLGDGVMFHFTDPARAVLCSLDLVAATPTAELPPAHVGVNAGPVIFRDGDYFGRTVNIAARIASQAGPEEVLVSEDVVAAANVDTVRFESRGPAELKGVARPVPLYLAQRA
jgi:class 3 adenylate cyclase